MEIGVVYKILNLKNNKVYIGSTLNFNSRKNQHIKTLRNNIHHSIKLQRAWNKYGEQNFIFVILEEVNSKNLLIVEQKYIDLFLAYKNGYNISKIAGSNAGIKRSKETREKMSKTRTGVKTGKRSAEALKNIIDSKKNINFKLLSEKRIKTLLNKDVNIFKKIAEKSAKTQKLNGKNVGAKNPNANNDNIFVFNEMDEIVYIVNNNEFDNLCIANNLPKRCLIKSKRTNGTYKLYTKQKPNNKEFIKYTGWYCKYEKTIL